MANTTNSLRNLKAQLRKLQAGKAKIPGPSARSANQELLLEKLNAKLKSVKNKIKEVSANIDFSDDKSRMSGKKAEAQSVQDNKIKELNTPKRGRPKKGSASSPDKFVSDIINRAQSRISAATFAGRPAPTLDEAINSVMNAKEKKLWKSRKSAADYKKSGKRNYDKKVAKAVGSLGPSEPNTSRPKQGKTEQSGKRTISDRLKAVENNLREKQAKVKYDNDAALSKENQIAKDKKALKNRLKQVAKNKNPATGESKSVRDTYNKRKLEQKRLAKYDKIKMTPKKVPLGISKGSFGRAALAGIASTAAGRLTAPYAKEYFSGQRDSSDEGSRDYEKYDKLNNLADYIENYGGYGTAASAAALGTGIGIEANRNRYNLTRDPNGMGRIDALKQLGKDSVAAMNDPYERFKAKYSRSGKGFKEDPLLTETRYDNKIAKLDEAGSKRFRDPNYDKYVKYNESVDKKISGEFDEAAKMNSAANAREKFKASGGNGSKSPEFRPSVRQQLIADRINTAIADIDNAILREKSPGLDGDGNEGPNKKRGVNTARVKSLNDSRKTHLDDIDDLMRMTNAELKTNPSKFEKYGYSDMRGKKIGDIEVKNILDEVDIAARSMGRRGSDLIDSGSDVIKKGFGNGRELLERAKTGNNQKFVDAKNAVKDGVTKTSEVISDGIDAAKEGATKASSAVKEAVSPEKKSALQRGKDALKARLNQIRGGNKSGVVKTPEQITEELNADSAETYSSDVEGEATNADKPKQTLRERASYISKHPVKSVYNGAKSAGKSAGRTLSKAGVPLTGGDLFNSALKTKQELEDQGVGPIVQNLINNGAPQEEVDAAIREEMAWKFAGKYLDPMIEAGDRLDQWAGKDMSAYDRVGDVLSTTWDVTKGIGQGIYDAGAGTINMGARMFDPNVSISATEDAQGNNYGIPGYGKNTGGVYNPFTVVYNGDSPTALNSVDKNDNRTTKAPMTEGAEDNQGLAKTRRMDSGAYTKYDTPQNYAASAGAKYVNGGGRYGDTPVYSNMEGNSFSDNPVLAANPNASTSDPAYIEAAKARRDYLKYEDKTRKQSEMDSVPTWAKPFVSSPGQYASMAPKDKGKLYQKSLDLNQSQYEIDKDVYTRMVSGTPQDKQALNLQLAEQSRNNPRDPGVRVQANIANNMGAYDRAFKVPFGGSGDFDPTASNVNPNNPADTQPYVEGTIQAWPFGGGSNPTDSALNSNVTYNRFRLGN